MIFTSRALLNCELGLRREDLLFIYCHIHLLDQKAISRDSVTLFKEKNIAYYDVFYWDCRRDPVLASNNGGLLSLDLFHKILELIFLAKITDCRYQSHKEDRNVD